MFKPIANLTSNFAINGVQVLPSLEKIIILTPFSSNTSRVRKREQINECNQILRIYIIYTHIFMHLYNKLDSKTKFGQLNACVIYNCSKRRMISLASEEMEQLPIYLSRSIYIEREDQLDFESAKVVIVSAEDRCPPFKALLKPQGF